MAKTHAFLSNMMQAFAYGVGVLGRCAVVLEPVTKPDASSCARWGARTARDGWCIRVGECVLWPCACLYLCSRQWYVPGG